MYNWRVWYIYTIRYVLFVMYMKVNNSLAIFIPVDGKGNPVFIPYRGGNRPDM